MTREDDGTTPVTKVKARTDLPGARDEASGASSVIWQYIVSWALGLGFIWWVLAALRLGGRFTIRRRRSPLAPASLIPLFLGLVLLGSLFANLLAGNVQFVRIPGALYAAIVWLCIFVVFESLNRGGLPIHRAVMTGLMWIATVQGGVTAVAILLHPSPLSSIQLPIARILGGENFRAAPWGTANLAYDDYFGGAVIRSAGLMGYAAWAGGFACLMLLALVGYRASLIDRKFLWWSALTGSIVTLQASYSRVSVALLAIGLAAMLFAKLLKSLLGRYAVAFWIPATAATLLTVAATFPFRQFLSDQDALRPGSSDSRFASYLSGIDVAFGHGLFPALVGNGAKPALDEGGFGAGSESTYVSLLVRGGLLALLLFCLFLSREFISRVRSHDVVGAILVSTLAVHAAVEDLDLGTLTLLVALVSLAPRRSELRSPAAARVMGKLRRSGRYIQERRHTSPARDQVGES